MFKVASNDSITRLIVGVTGHRRLREAEMPALREKVRAFFLALNARYPNLPMAVLSCLAEGSDQLVAQVALELGVQVIAAMPMPVELYRSDFESVEAAAVFERQFAQAEVLTLPVRNDDHLGNIACVGPERDQQYAKAGIFISSHCHILLTLWDGRESALVGGTAQVVHFHLHGDMPGHSGGQHAALAQLGLDEETLLFHIPTNRQGDTDISLMPARWITSGAESGSKEMPAAFDLMFRRQAQFNVDCIAGMKLPASAATVEDRICPIHALFSVADRLATLYQRRVSGVLRATYGLAALMGFALINYSGATSHQMIYLFLAFFLLGVAIAGIAKRREWHRKYIDYRTLAEGLRVQSFWWRAAISDFDSLFFAHDNFLQKQDVGLGWIRNVMRDASLKGIQQPAPIGDDVVDWVVARWIGAPEGGGQLSYYSETAKWRARLHRRSQLMAACCLWLGLGIGVLLAFFVDTIASSMQGSLFAVMGMLSVTAGVHDAYAFKKADKELIKQYSFMLRIFSAARRRLDDCKTVAEKRQVLRTLGEAALAEHAEWTLMHRERPIDYSRF